MVIRHYYLLPLLGFLFVVLCVLSAIHAFSPVPCWDMWDSYLNVYSELKQGHWGILWAQHNEHRMMFGRLFFLVDLAFFHGQTIMLIGSHFILMGCLWLTLYKSAKSLFAERWTSVWAFAYAGVLAMLCFSWIQSENITWAFQGTFFAAFLFPLLTLHCFAVSIQSHDRSTSLRYFIFSLLSGLVALGTLACGILTFPLLTVMALLMRQSLQRIIVLVMLTAFAIVSYLYHYIPPAHHGHLLNTLQQTPLQFFEFILAYLGGPFFFILKRKLIFPVTFGFIYTSSLLFFSIRWYRIHSKNPVYLALLLFATYILATALLTASGRTIFGVLAALSSRYMTPVILGWCALLILFGYEIQLTQKKIYSYLLYSVAVIFSLLLLIPQIKALGGEATVTKFDRNIAALALILNIKDDNAVSKIFPNQHIYAAAASAKEQGLSIFINPHYTQLAQYLNTNINSYATRPCIGQIASFKKIKTVDHVTKVSGWAMYADNMKVPKQVLLVNSTGNIVGVSLTGSKRKDVAHHYHHRIGLYSGFAGYVIGEHQPLTMRCLA